MSLDAEEMIQLLLKTNKEQEQTITDLRATIKDLRSTIANLNETLDELKRKLFGSSSEKTKASQPVEETVPEAEPTTIVKEHKRVRKKKSVRADLYEALPVVEVPCDIPEEERICPDCDSKMEHLAISLSGKSCASPQQRSSGYGICRKPLFARYAVKKMRRPSWKGKHQRRFLHTAPASPDMVATVMYQKSFLHLPFYRQSKDWLEKGVPVPRETAAHWYNYCALNYLLPVYEVLHQELLKREVLHADEVPCQVLHEEGKSATSKSYMWIYLSGTDGLPPIILYDYRPGRSGDHPIEFLSGFTGLLHCDGYAAYGRIEDVILVCCLAHCRRKFFEAVPKARQKNLKLLDINSEQEITEPPEGTAADEKLLPAEKGVAFCNRLFYLERLYKGFPAEERSQRRQEKEPAVWNEFWSWLDTLDPAGGSKLEKAVNYALNHKETLMNYLLDGRCEISNNAAERRAKTYVTGRKNFLFHDTTNGAIASAIVLSIIETAKANGLNIFQYLYTLLLYMPDYKDEPAGIEKLMPWSDFIKERCTGITDIENVRPENRGNLNI